MKRSFKMIVMMLALTFGALIFNGASSQAAVSITNVKQTKASSDYVELQWDAVFYGDRVYYRVYYGSSASSLTGYSDTSSTDETLYHLTEGSTYYARVVAFADYKRQTPIAESEVIQVSTSLKEVTNTKQTGATANSVTLTWDAVAGATAYEIYRYDGWRNHTQVGSSVGTTATISGLNAASKVQLFVIPTKVINGTTKISGTDINTIYAKTAPSKVQYIAITNFWYYLNDAQFGWNAVQNADGYQLQVKNYIQHLSGYHTILQECIYKGKSKSLCTSKWTESIRTMVRIYLHRIFFQCKSDPFCQQKEDHRKMEKDQRCNQLHNLRIYQTEQWI